MRLYIYITVLFLTACASNKNYQEAPTDKFTPSSISVVSQRIVTEEGQKKYNWAWNKILKTTDIQLISNNRLQVTAKGSYFSDIEDIEYKLLGRVAGEVRSKGYKKFSIRHIKYQPAEFIFGSSASNLTLSELGWYGTYEDLVQSRINSDILNNANKVGKKKISAIVYFYDEDSHTNRPYFNADEIFYNMLEKEISK